MKVAMRKHNNQRYAMIHLKIANNKAAAVCSVLQNALTMSSSAPWRRLAACSSTISTNFNLF